jgi:galactose-1-phosphate uridylyltransferase
VESQFLDPRLDFSPKIERLQVRFDPLTGRSAHLAHFGAAAAEELDLARYAEPRIKGFCPFCAENRQRATPKFPPDFISEGRWGRGQALLIPNLHPYDAYGSIVVMTENHVVPLAGLTDGLLLDALLLGCEFMQRVQQRDPAERYPLMAWNYMPPSGGGLVHPHQQYFATRYPGNLYVDEFHASKRFLRTMRSDYWSQLVHEEQRRGERYIGSTGSVQWLAPFAPMGILGEVLGVLPGVCELVEFTEDRAENLVEGLRRVFQYFTETGIQSFNATLFFGPASQEHFAAHFRLIPRTFLNLRDFAPDLNFYQALLQEPVSVVLPEDLCRSLKRFFE